MPEEAKLERVGNGLVPRTDGWFVVNAREAAWTVREGFGVRCTFAADVPALRGHEDEIDFEPWSFAQLGVTLTVIEPGGRSTLYHAETAQEDFLVLSGTCLAVIEEQERTLRAWDFVHCPAGTRHAFANEGAEPCVMLAVGARHGGRGVLYPLSEVARRHGLGAEAETDDPRQAYAAFPHWRNADEASPGRL